MKVLRFVSIRNPWLVVMIGLFVPVLAISQESEARFHVSITGDVHPKSHSVLISGTQRLEFLASWSGHLELGWRLTQRNMISTGVYYRFGITSYRTRTVLFQREYSVLRHDVDSKFYGTHRYHSLGLVFSLTLSKIFALNVGVGNRFYVSSHTGLTITSFRAVSLTPMVIFRANTGISRRYFCPEINLQFECMILSRYPSFKLAVETSLAPHIAIEGDYTYFPNDQQYTSSGTVRIVQSYLGIGIIYRRIRQTE